MPRSRVSCPGCGQKEITWDHRECVECHKKRRREEAEANRPIPRSGTNVPISGNFEFRFKSNRLDSVARDLGCPFVKTEVEKSKWAEAMLDGSTEAMDYIVEHCEVDVKVLAWVSKRIAPYVRQIDVLGSFRQ